MVSDEVGDSAWSSLAVPLIPLSAYGLDVVSLTT